MRPRFPRVNETFGLRLDQPVLTPPGTKWHNKQHFKRLRRLIHNSLKYTPGSARTSSVRWRGAVWAAVSVTL